MSILYTLDMDITNWNNDEIMRLVMAKGHITQKILLKNLKDKTGLDIPQSTFSCKIRKQMQTNVYLDVLFEAFWPKRPSVNPLNPKLFDAKTSRLLSFCTGRYFMER